MIATNLVKNTAWGWTPCLRNKLKKMAVWRQCINHNNTIDTMKSWKYMVHQFCSDPTLSAWVLWVFVIFLQFKHQKGWEECLRQRTCRCYDVRWLCLLQTSFLDYVQVAEWHACCNNIILARENMSDYIQIKLGNWKITYLTLV